MKKLSQQIAERNQKADLIEKYEDNIAFKKKLHILGTVLSVVGIVVASVFFILIGVFGNDLQSISKHTAILALSFAMLVLFFALFCVGIYFLKKATSLHTEKPVVENKVAATNNLTNAKNIKNDVNKDNK